MVDGCVFKLTLFDGVALSRFKEFLEFIHFDFVVDFRKAVSVSLGDIKID